MHLFYWCPIMFGYIYRTTNKINGAIYVGQHHGEFDPRYFGSGNIILKAIKKYGKDNFSVEKLLIAENQNQLDELEIREIDNHRKCHPSEKIYNIARGGLGHAGPFSKEHIEKLAALNRSEKKQLIMKLVKRGPHSKESIELMRKAKLGKVHSDETKRKMSESQKAFNSFRSKESNRLRSETMKRTLALKKQNLKTINNQ